MTATKIWTIGRFQDKIREKEVWTKGEILAYFGHLSSAARQAFVSRIEGDNPVPLTNAEMALIPAAVPAETPPVVKSLTTEEKKLHKFPVDTIRKYDIVGVQTMASMHYVIVHKVVGNLVWGVVMTSKCKHFCLAQIENDRRFKDSYITNTYMSFDIEECKKGFVSVFEDKKLFNTCIQELRTLYKKLLSVK